MAHSLRVQTAKACLVAVVLAALCPAAVKLDSSFADFNSESVVAELDSLSRASKASPPAAPKQSAGNQSAAPVAVNRPKGRVPDSMLDFDCSEMTMENLCDKCRSVCQKGDVRYYSLCNIRCLGWGSDRCNSTVPDDPNKFGCPAYVALGSKGVSSSDNAIDEDVEDAHDEPTVILTPDKQSAHRQKRNAASDTETLIEQLVAQQAWEDRIVRAAHA